MLRGSSGRAADRYDWPDLPEETASGLCYTSGTTGHPKGALYSQRSTVLHAMQVPLCQTSSFRAGRRVMPVVPLFHVNAWGLPYTAPLTGMTLVMPGPDLDGPSLFRLMDAERVYSAWGVPTVWAGLLTEIEAQGRIPQGFGDLVVGGSAAPRVMIEAYEARGVNVAQAWGMTEMSPIGSHGVLPPALERRPRPSVSRPNAVPGGACSGWSSRSSMTPGSACRMTARRPESFTCAATP